MSKYRIVKKSNPNSVAPPHDDYIFDLEKKTAYQGNYFWENIDSYHSLEYAYKGLADYKKRLFTPVVVYEE